MRPSPAADLAALVRLRNLLLAAAGVAIGGVLVQGRVAFPRELWLAMVSAFGIGAAGNVANDLFDLDADRVNRPDRPLVAGRLSTNAAILIGGLLGGAGLVAAALVDRRLLALALAALVVMLVYSPLLKQHGVAGNVAVALVAGLPPVYGASALGWPRGGVVAFALAALLHFAREVVKDIEDVAGDQSAGRRTIPLVYGPGAAYLVAAATLVLFVPASLAPWFMHWYGPRYGITVMLLDAGLAYLIWRLMDHQLAHARSALKVAMLVGLFALLWDRL
jgi:geranylgeranylglycerol-phosphate geranylgeranyltransferase